jgi:exoribonuclease II
MEPGNIVEYIDSRKIICAVVMEIKKHRLRLLTESNREVNISTARLAYKSDTRLPTSDNRDKLVKALKEVADLRKSLADTIDIKEVWEILNSEQEWIDLPTMASFCFQTPVNSDHLSAVMRGFFKNRTYFKFDVSRFLPYTQDQVADIIAKKEEEERKNQTIKFGGDWLKKALSSDELPEQTEKTKNVVEILKSFYLFEKESPHFQVAKEIIKRAGLKSTGKLFELLFLLGEWDINENIDLLRLDIPIDFSDEIKTLSDTLSSDAETYDGSAGRQNLIELPLMTIDGESTVDFDDALSIEKRNNHYRLGIHISDVGHFIKKGDEIDQEACVRGSSIYTPDQKIPMLPMTLSENACSLRAGEKRPAISLFITLNRLFEIEKYEIIPSVICVTNQLTYNEVDRLVDQNEEIKTLLDIAHNFRKKRLSSGALQITLPEVHVSVKDKELIMVKKVDRESPARILVSELMIMANWLMARFLNENNTPAIFRSQPAPKNRLIKNGTGTLFQNCLQRKHLSRGSIGPEPEHHSGLGLDAYVTSTSPIRRYFDMVTQRQIRAVLGLENPYSSADISRIIQNLEQTIQNIAKIQFMRNRYWILKYLENRTGEREEAIVIDSRRDHYTVMLTEYMMECGLSHSSGMNLKPGDLVRVTIQHSNARNDALSIYMG